MLELKPENFPALQLQADKRRLNWQKRAAAARKETADRKHQELLAKYEAAMREKRAATGQEE